MSARPPTHWDSADEPDSWPRALGSTGGRCGQPTYSATAAIPPQGYDSYWIPTEAFWGLWCAVDDQGFGIVQNAKSGARAPL